MHAAQPDIYSHTLIHPSAYVDAPCQIGEGTKIWHFSHIMAHCTIGKNVNIGQNVVINPKVTIGTGCKIQNNVSVYTGVHFEDYVFCGPSVVFTNVLNPRSEIVRKNENLPTLIQRGASLGANSTILCGNTIGRYAFVAAGAVVTSDVPPYALVLGIPAKVVGWVCRCGRRLSKFEQNSNVDTPLLTCNYCQNIYRAIQRADQWEISPIQEQPLT